MDTATTWAIVIGGATLLLVIVSLIWGTGLWKRREKVKIRVTTLNYGVHFDPQAIDVDLAIEFHRTGGNDIRYVHQVLLKPDKEIYNQLRQYFELPSDGIIKLGQRMELPRDKFISSRGFIPKLTFEVSPNLRNKIERSEVESIASQLSQKSYKIGLVWEDNGKITWKAVSTEAFGKWV